MKGLQQHFRTNEEIQAIASMIEAGVREQLITGLTGSARALFVSSLYSETARPLLVVTHNLYQAQKLYEDFIEFLNEDQVLLYPVNELISAEIAIASPEMKAQRIEVLNRLVQSFNGIVIAPIAGLRRQLPPKHVWELHQIELKTGADIGETTELIEKLVTMGFQRVDMVSSPGEVSVRGGIIDLYPLTVSDPIRIELFDTEIESIRSFQIETQRSAEEMDSVLITPVQEVLLRNVDYKRAEEQLRERLSATLKKVKSNETKEKLTQNVSFEISQLKQLGSFQGMYKYMSLYYEDEYSLLSYLSENTCIVFDELSRIKETADHLDQEEAQWSTALLEQGEMVHDVRMSLPVFEEIRQKRFSSIYLSLFLKHVPSTNPENVLSITCKSMQEFHGQLSLLKSEVGRWQKQKQAIVF